MAEKTFTLQVPIKCNTEAIYDLLWSAFNSGSTYWLGEITTLGNCIGSTYMSHLIGGGTLIINVPVDDNDEEFEKHMLTLEKFLKGLELYFANGFEGISNGRVDTGSIDASMSDIVLQYSLFNDIVFG